MNWRRNEKKRKRKENARKEEKKEKEKIKKGNTVISHGHDIIKGLFGIFLKKPGSFAIFSLYNRVLIYICIYRFDFLLHPFSIPNIPNQLKFKIKNFEYLI